MAMFTRRTMMGSALAALAAPWFGAAAQARPALQSTPESMQSPLRLGLLTDLSGPLAALGKRQVLGAQYRVDQLNGGGMHGGEQQVELLIRDAAGDAGAAASALLDEGVHAVIGGVAPWLSAPIAAQCQLACTPLIAPSSGDAPTQPYVFQVGPDSAAVMKALLAAAKAGGAKKVGHLVLDKLATPGLLEAATAQSAAQGVAIVGTEQVPLDAADLAPALGKLTGAAPDALLITSLPPQSASAVQAARDGGFTGPIVLAPDGVPPGLEPDPNLKAVVPWVTLADAVTDSVPNVATLRRFAAGFGGGADPAVGYGVDAVSLAHLAFLGQRDRKTGREQLENACCAGVCGAYAMTPMNHAGLDRNALVTAVMKDGVWQPAG